MARRIEALVNPEMLVWARKRSHYDIFGAAKRVGVRPEKILAWEEGTARPTIRQAKILAQIYRCPLSAFYLKERPRDVQIAVKDFRKAAVSGTGEWSPALAREMLLAEERRKVLLDLAEPDEGYFRPPSGLDVEASPESAAAQLRAWLNVGIGEQFDWKTPERAFRGWIDALENANVVVFQTKVRGLSVEPEETHGFCLSYDRFPAVVVNARDVLTRRIFTLLHEFVHLVLRQSGVCDLEDNDQWQSWTASPEVLSNRVAGALLVPLDALRHEIERLHAGSGPDWDERVIHKLAARFGVSREVVVRRLLIAGLTTREYYLRKQQEYREQWELSRERRKLQKKKGFPPESVLVLRENGLAYCKKVFRAYFDDKLNLTDVSDLLDTKIKHVVSIQKEIFSLPIAG